MIRFQTLKMSLSLFLCRALSLSHSPICYTFWLVLFHILFIRFSAATWKCVCSSHFFVVYFFCPTRARLSHALTSRFASSLTLPHSSSNKKHTAPGVYPRAPGPSLSNLVRVHICVAIAPRMKNCRHWNVLKVRTNNFAEIFEWCVHVYAHSRCMYSYSYYR